MNSIGGNELGGVTHLPPVVDADPETRIRMQMGILREAGAAKKAWMIGGKTGLSCLLVYSYVPFVFV